MECVCGCLSNNLIKSVINTRTKGAPIGVPLLMYESGTRSRVKKKPQWGFFSGKGRVPPPAPKQKPPKGWFLFWSLNEGLEPGSEVNEAPVGLQSRAPTKRERESNPVASLFQKCFFFSNFIGVLASKYKKTAIPPDGLSCFVFSALSSTP